jgi:hypothetical protein
MGHGFHIYGADPAASFVAVELYDLLLIQSTAEIAWD